MEGFKGNPGINQLAGVLSQRMKSENESPLVLDFGEIQANGSLMTNTFPKPIPKGEYSVCRQLTLGAEGEEFAETKENGEHVHPNVEESGKHSHVVILPQKLRSAGVGDRVLVAWVQNEAVVVDIIERS